MHSGVAIDLLALGASAWKQQADKETFREEERRGEASPRLRRVPTAAQRSGEGAGGGPWSRGRGPGVRGLELGGGVRSYQLRLGRFDIWPTGFKCKFPVPASFPF